MVTMRIAVTGAAGFIGGKLVSRLLASGHRVDAIDLRTAAAPGCVVGDVREAGALSTVITPSTDAVVHLAAVAGVRPSLADPDRYFAHNVLGTLRVLQACERAGVPRVIVASSSSVYGDCPEPAREDRGPAPLSPYAASKLGAEALAESWARRGAVEAVVVRPFTVYGPGQRPDMAITRFLAALARGESLPMWPFVRDFTYVDDVVDGLVGALVVQLPADGCRTYNLGSGRPVPATELVEALRDVTGHDVRVTPIAPGPGEATRTAADPSRAIAELPGFHPRTALRDGLYAQSRWRERALVRL
jgi:nucleoside-diphosphate-sugar epimerase